MPASKRKQTNKPKVGRPSAYKDHFAEQARKLCLLGATDKELGDFFEVSEQTINEWKKKHPEFLESIKKGKEIADAEVASKLYHRAKGYEHEETKVFQYEGLVITSDPVVKHYPPDATAAIFWLKNRQPNRWRDRKENVNLEADGDIVVEYKKADE